MVLKHFQKILRRYEEANVEAMGTGCMARRSERIACRERASLNQSIMQSILYIPSETATFI